MGAIIINGKQHTPIDGARGVQITPQQVAIAVSTEDVAMIAGFVGLVQPKTSLCNEGILCLNTGVVDPGFDGPISSTIINFSKENKFLAFGESFLRLTVTDLSGVGSNLATPSAVERESYLRTRAADSARLPKTFMDIEKLHGDFVKSVEKEVLGRQSTLIGKWIAIIGFVALIWNLAAYVIFQRETAGVENRAASLSLDIAKLEQRGNLPTRLDSLDSRLLVLERAMTTKLAVPPKKAPR